MKLYWFSHSTNVKTGNIPHAVVGATLEQTRRSCKGCSLLDGQCYAWAPGSSIVNFALRKLRIGLVHEKRGPEYYTAKAALKRRHHTARYVRLTTIGDPARVHFGSLCADIRKAWNAGLRILGYTHFWREHPRMADSFMASCGSPEEVDEALAAGFRATTVMPWDHHEKSGRFFLTPGGERGVICPAQWKDSITCNSCGLCSNEHPAADKIRVIGFLDHGPTARKQKRHAKKHARTLPMFQGATA